MGHAARNRCPPERAQVLVIGGGPAGSYAASALAREGFDVVVFEATKFPRYHIGESLIPSVRHYLRFIDAEKKVERYGFALKPGAGFKLNQYKREGYTDFLALGHDTNAWNVPRAEFDQLLLDHASECGARVFQQTRVAEVHFERHKELSAVTALPSGDVGRAVAASYVAEMSDGSKREGRIAFDYVVDASGRAGIISSKYLKNRRFTESLKNLAIWGYWRGTNLYMANSESNRRGATYFEALTDESGWAWFIPLHNGTTSVGIVMHQQIYNGYVKADPTGTARPSLVDRYTSLLDLAPGVKKLIHNGEFVTGSVGVDERGIVGDVPPVKMASDFSYSASRYAGNGWRIIGDAGAFIDPFFSSGIHLAFTGGLAAAASISASIRGDCDEHSAAKWHTERIAISYTRFLVVVLGAYKQIRSQSSAVLSDIDEDNFDRAFNTIRPIIQGASDIGARLCPEELDNALDFCGKLFAPTTPEMHQAASRRVPLEMMDVNAPVRDIGGLKMGEEDEDTVLVLEKVNARRFVHKDHGGISNFEDEPLSGWAARLQRGTLGLVKLTE
ncbi:FAD/NAD(P)-binding domain-containing protein [Punctularia strigosozonata HHB-11173 SS5]|uniref:FAD/NAD(P)-binding domain-containing protein n=1 Tax=Punctularia strigosozonata (strain HHB-11173) TaxID=741275 RepID=UPI0004417B42|nr:FAD/NAD(P)-binding domain-containing protein [Punctularia strigosozonata HHB-11173 SS5]EIN06722.1 FAD/NAD(P)-binding domain-containing protein [Punctularia strigosozonata HHB-11173 SS5]